MILSTQKILKQINFNLYLLNSLRYSLISCTELSNYTSDLFCDLLLVIVNDNLEHSNVFNLLPVFAVRSGCN